jgi:hypothetical protein
MKTKKIAIFANYSLGSPPFELHNGLIEKLKAKNHITVYLCNASLNGCTPNPTKEYFTCRYCISKQVLYRDLHPDVEFKILPDLTVAQSQRVPDAIIDSLDLSAMSTVASYTRCTDESELTAAWGKTLRGLEKTSQSLFSYFVSEIKESKFDMICAFNGRFVEAKPVIEAAKFCNVDFGIVEVKKSVNPIFFINELIHSIEANTRRAFQFYLLDIRVARQNAEKFYNAKIQNISTGDPVYTKNQDKGRLPRDFDTNKKIITIYPSSDDEYKFIGKEWDGIVPHSQLEEISALVENIKDTEFQVIVKMHPNQARTAGNVQQQYRELQRKFGNVVVEEPESKVDSYELLFKSDIVVNFASTIGVEANYFGKVVVMIGDTNFSRMKIGYQTYTGKEAAALISKGGLIPKPKRGAIIWANYLLEYKDNLPGYSSVGNRYYFRGARLRGNLIYYGLQLVQKLFVEIKMPGNSGLRYYINRIMVKLGV